MSLGVHVTSTIPLMHCSPVMPPWPGLPPAAARGTPATVDPGRAGDAEAASRPWPGLWPTTRLVRVSADSSWSSWSSWSLCSCLAVLARPAAALGRASGSRSWSSWLRCCCPRARPRGRAAPVLRLWPGCSPRMRLARSCCGRSWETGNGKRETGNGKRETGNGK